MMPRRVTLPSRCLSACVLSSTLLAGALGVSATALADEGPAWSYAEAGQWESLSDDYAACGKGANQSPVDIVAPLETERSEPVLDYPVAGHSVVHDGHTLKVEFPSGNTLMAGGRDYRLRQLHFHVPAEHRIAGREFAMEAHLVHASPEGHLAVLAVLFERGDASRILADVLPRASAASGQRVELRDGIDARLLLGDQLDTYRLNGSLTTPPCTEGVLWWVAKRPRTLSEPQLEELSSLIGEANNRPLQPLNARRVLD